MYSRRTRHVLAFVYNVTYLLGSVLFPAEVTDVGQIFGMFFLVENLVACSSVMTSTLASLDDTRTDPLKPLTHCTTRYRRPSDRPSASAIRLVTEHLREQWADYLDIVAEAKGP